MGHGSNFMLLGLLVFFCFSIFIANINVSELININININCAVAREIYLVKCLTNIEKGSDSPEKGQCFAFMRSRKAYSESGPLAGRAARLKSTRRTADVSWREWPRSLLPHHKCPANAV